MRRSGFNEQCIKLDFRYGDFHRHIADCAQKEARWAASWDFKSFYHSVKLHRSLWSWTTVRSGVDNGMLCFVVVPFGVSWGCFVASVIMAEMLAVLATFGYDLSFGYIDDGRIAGRTKGAADDGLVAAIAVAVGGGLQIQPSKTTRATRTLDYLGLRTSMRAGATTVTLRPDRWPRLRTAISTIAEL